MSADSAAFRSLMEQVREGQPEAIQNLIDQYGDHLLRVIRRRLHQKMRPKYDSQDFCQAVWASFFALSQDFVFEQPEQLLAFLGDLARNKVVEAIRQRLIAKKYNIGREVPLSRIPNVPEDNNLAGREPTPSAIAVAREEWERLMTQQPEKHQRILALLHKGQTHEQVARQLGLSEKSIQRLLRKLHTGPSHEPR